MKRYELTYLISPNLSEEEAKKFSSKVNDFAIEEKAVLKKTKEPIKKQLGCLLKKKKEAFLSVLEFYLEPENLKNLEKKLKKENEILRYLILVKKETKKKEKEKTVQTKKMFSLEKEKIAKSESSVPSPEIKKAELKEIDKKIEEILNP